MTREYGLATRVKVWCVASRMLRSTIPFFKVVFVLRAIKQTAVSSL